MLPHRRPFWLTATMLRKTATKDLLRLNIVAKVKLRADGRKEDWPAAWRGLQTRIGAEQNKKEGGSVALGCPPCLLLLFGLDPRRSAHTVREDPRAILSACS